MVRTKAEKPGAEPSVFEATLTVLGRGYCHLCDDMLAGLEPFRVSHNVSIRVVDVDESPELESLYGEQVPVLFLGEREICHHFLDAARLTRALDLMLDKDAPAIR